MIIRTLESDIHACLQTNEITVLYGARQVGKTTLLQTLFQAFEGKKVWYNGDLARDRDALSHEDDIILRPYIAPFDLVIIDEAQRIDNIGLVLKIIHEYYPQTKVIASGSSSFDLANKINEPLTGRSYFHTLYPLSIEEILPSLPSPTAFVSLLPSLLVCGSYPRIYTILLNGGNPLKELAKLTDGYLYKDILAIDTIKKSQVIEKLLKLLALQCGKIVSYSEIAMKLEINKATVEKYISLLEKSFIVFMLPIYSGNTRKSIGKQQKIYFWDLGIRNSLIQSFGLLEDRVDKGELFENFVIAERIKFCHYHNLPYQHFYRRNYAQAEVDLIETHPDGSLYGYEIKYTHPKAPSRGFTNDHPDAHIACITKDTCLSYIMRP